MSRDIDDGMRHGGLVYSSSEEKELDRIQMLYNELIMGVARKWPGETRHQTALRYIQEAERKPQAASQSASTLRPAVTVAAPATNGPVTPNKPMRSRPRG